MRLAGWPPGQRGEYKLQCETAKHVAPDHFSPYCLTNLGLVLSQHYWIFQVGGQMLDLCSIVVGRRVVFKWEPRHRLQSCPVTFVFRCRPSRGGGRRACDVEWPLFVWTLLPDISTPVLSPKLSKMRTAQSSFQCLVI